MEFTNEFVVPSDIETTFATLTDLEKVAPCLPGATLEEVDGDTYTGRVKVKVGPAQVTYRGTARMVEADAEAKRGRIEARGKETRGTGTASADVEASLREDGDGTRVTVVTDLAITGKVAQFGRGVMAEVGSNIIDAFADRLREMLEEGEREEPTPAPPGAAEGTVVSPPGDAIGRTDGPRRIAQVPGREDDTLDFMDVAGGAMARRLAPLAAAVAIALLLVWWLRRR